MNSEWKLTKKELDEIFNSEIGVILNQASSDLIEEFEAGTIKGDENLSFILDYLKGIKSKKSSYLKLFAAINTAKKNGTCVFFFF